MHEEHSPILATDKERQQLQSKRAYLDALPTYPEFELTNNEIDALLPSAKVESWKALLDILQGPDFKRANNDLIYRGHAGHDWQLTSTLGRLFDGGAIPSDKRDRLLRQFKLSMRGRGYDLAPLLGEDNEVWAVGQHHGLKTPLLDWTRSPFVALFFAFSKYESVAETSENPSRALFCLNKTRIEEDLGLEFSDTLFLEPEDNQNSRLVNQSGLFTVAPNDRDNLVSDIVNHLDEQNLLSQVDETETRLETSSDAGEGDHASFTVNDRKRAQLLAQYIFKLHIPNTVEARKDCLEALRQMNIHHGNLFPDPVGASEFCNDWLARLVEEEKQGKQRKAGETRPAQDQRIARPATASERADVSGDVKQILTIFLELDNEESEQLASGIELAVNDSASIDWHNFTSKQAQVKLAIRKTIAQGPGTFKAQRTPRDLIDRLMEKYLAEAKKSETI